MPGGSGSSLQKALALHQAGRFGEAEALYRQLPQNDPNALQLLGVLLFQTGRSADGKSQLLRALEIDPHHIEALTNLGVALHQESQFSEALSLIERALVAQPNRPDLHDKRGFILQDLDRHEEAIKSFEVAVALNSQLGDAWFHLGHSLSRLERFEEAEAANLAVVKLLPTHAEAWSNLGESLFRQHKIDQALTASRKSIQVHPTAGAYHNLGLCFSQLGQSEQAIKAVQLATQLAPKDAVHHAELGGLYLSDNQHEAAIQAYSRSATLSPTSVEYQKKLGEARYQSGDLAGCLKTYEAVKQVDPSTQLLSALSIAVIPSSHEELVSGRERVRHSLNALRIEGVISDPYAEVGRTPFYLNYQPELDLEMNRLVGSAYLAACPSLGWQSPHFDAKSDGKIRVGIVSAFMNRHSVGRWFLKLVMGLADEEFELIFFDTGNRADDWSAALGEKCAKSVRLFPDLEASRQEIAGERLDAVFYPEIGMDPLSYYLAFARLAPFQLTMAGNPWSSGLPNIDVFLSSEAMESAGSESHYSERLFKSKSPVFVVEPGYAPSLSREDFGLPSNKRIYFCPQPPFKIHPDFDEALNQILTRDPDGLVVLVPGRNKPLTERLLARFERTIPDKKDRIVLIDHLSYDRYLGLAACADVGLDTFYFGGGTSSLDMLSAGTPVVTWPQELLKGRITHSLYMTMGMEGLSAKSAEQYVDTALRVANDREWQMALTTEIEAKRGVLFMNHGVVDEVKDLLRKSTRR